MSDADAGSAPALARAEGYWFLADLVARPPTAESLARLGAELPVASNEDHAEVKVADLMRQLRGAATGSPPEAVAGRLGPEHARLFGGLHPDYGPPPPFESVYRGGQFMGDVTLAVVQAFADAGMGPLDESLGPCDHLASELKFMAALCVRESEAWGADGDAAAEPWLLRQRDFLRQHLLAWLPDWEAAIRSATDEAYFLHLAALACAAVRSDKALIDARLRDGSY